MNLSDLQSQQPVITREQAEVQIRAFINKVYGWMALALILTGFVAWWVANDLALARFIASNNFIFYGLLIGTLLMVGALSGWVHRMSPVTAIAVFMGYSALNGVLLSFIFLVYTKESIASTFFITAGTFAVMSVYGFVTKTDLTRIGNLLFMALLGFLLASLANIFFHSETLYWVTTYAGILIFVGLVAYDTQRLKMMALGTVNDEDMMTRASVIGALRLYLDFINLFLLLLRIFGRRR